MKILNLFLAATFIVSLLTGLWVGSFIFSHKTALHQASVHAQNLPSSPGKQNGIWLIVIDRFHNKKPQIQSVWLLSYVSGYFKIKPLPLFPSGNLHQDNELTNSFEITSDQKIATTFWNTLQKYGIYAKNYIVFDQNAVVEVINYFGGVTIDGKHFSGNDLINSTHNIQDDPEAMMKRQTEIMDSLCKSIFNNNPPLNMEKLQKKIKTHIITNLDLSEQSNEYQELFANREGKFCEFPDTSGKPPVISKP